MPVSRKLSVAVSLIVVAATCLCVCTDSSSAAAIPAPAPHSCCDVDHGKNGPAQHPSNHDDCRACGLRVWSGARLTTPPVHPQHLAMPVAILPPVLALAPLFDRAPLSFVDSPPPAPTLLTLHCQLSC
jgi:hypothetical protein